MFLLLPEYLVSILPKSRYLDGLLFCALLGMVLKLQCFKLISLSEQPLHQIVVRVAATDGRFAVVLHDLVDLQP